jgi:hypothetical protein
LDVHARDLKDLGGILNGAPAAFAVRRGEIIFACGVGEWAKENQQAGNPQTQVLSGWGENAFQVHAGRTVLLVVCWAGIVPMKTGGGEHKNERSWKISFLTSCPSSGCHDAAQAEGGLATP